MGVSRVRLLCGEFTSAISVTNSCQLESLLETEREREIGEREREETGRERVGVGYNVRTEYMGKIYSAHTCAHTHIRACTETHHCIAETVPEILVLISSLESRRGGEARGQVRRGFWAGG